MLKDAAIKSQFATFHFDNRIFRFSSSFSSDEDFKPTKDSILIDSILIDSDCDSREVSSILLVLQ